MVEKLANHSIDNNYKLGTKKNSSVRQSNQIENKEHSSPRRRNQNGWDPHHEGTQTQRCKWMQKTSLTPQGFSEVGLRAARMDGNWRSQTQKRDSLIQENQICKSSPPIFGSPLNWVCTDHRFHGGHHESNCWGSERVSSRDFKSWFKSQKNTVTTKLLKNRRFFKEMMTWPLI